MTCPECGYNFNMKIVGEHGLVCVQKAGYELDDIMPVLCSFCGGISLYLYGTIRKVSEQELAAIKESPAYKVMRQAQQTISYRVN